MDKCSLASRDQSGTLMAALSTQMGKSSNSQRLMARQGGGVHREWQEVGASFWCSSWGEGVAEVSVTNGLVLGGYGRRMQSSSRLGKEGNGQAVEIRMRHGRGSRRSGGSSAA
jgi:hypothetical protein